MNTDPKDPAITIESTGIAFEHETRDVAPLGSDKPRVLFASSLVLSREQEDALCDHLKKQYELLDDQLGRKDTETEADGETPAFLSGAGVGSGLAGDVRPDRKFLSKRLLYQCMNENKMDFRRILHPNSIFSRSNLTVPLARRIATQQGARAVKYFFGTDPWLQQRPIGGDDDMAFAAALQKLTDMKFEDSGSTAALKRALQNAFVIGEAVMKVTSKRQVEFSKRLRVVAVGPDGKPLLASDGDGIEKEDTWTMVQDEMTGAEQMVLERDGQTVKPPGELVFAEVLMEEETEFYRGPKISQIYYRDFLCPINAPSVQEALCCVHVVEKTASDLAQMYLEYGDNRLEGVQKAVEAIKDAMGGSRQALSGDRGSRTELGDYESAQQTEGSNLYGEFYCRVDADGDGVTEDIMCVMNLATGYPVFYDYVANVTADGKRPFYVITPNPVLNRWYGQGAMERFETHQETVDLMLNRRNQTESESGYITLWNPRNTVEGQHNPTLALNRGTTYTPLPDKKQEDIIARIPLDDNGRVDNLTVELEFFMQLAMNESGVQHANDGQTAGLDSMKLATGIRQLERANMELFGTIVSELQHCLTPLCTCFVGTLYATLDDEETFAVFEGNVPRQMTIQKKQVKNLRFDIRTLLTRYRDEQQLVSNNEAYALLYGAKPYYDLPYELQVSGQRFVVNQLKSLQIEDPESYVVPQMVPMTTGSMPGAAPTGGPKQENTPAPLV